MEFYAEYVTSCPKEAMEIDGKQDTMKEHFDNEFVFIPMQQTILIELAVMSKHVCRSTYEIVMKLKTTNGRQWKKNKQKQKQKTKSNTKNDKTPLCAGCMATNPVEEESIWADG